MGVVRYKQKKSNIIKLEKYLKDVDRKQFVGLFNNLHNKKK
tara:strand:- start:391 stop:513 length:123 start_codon:yes stop_codon:yes gene_type:complete